MVLTASMDYQSRYFRRRRITTDQGPVLLIDAAEARSYNDGEIARATDGTEIVIRAAPEPLASIRGTGLARLAWHIGNRHTPCQVEEDRLLIQRDHVLEDMLRGLGALIEHIEEPFTPEGGAYGYGRTHGHSHPHDPHTDPNAHIPHRHD